MDASLGRFVTQDPFKGYSSGPMSLHKYLYANTNPVNGYDPSGYFTISWTMAPSLMTTALGRAVLMQAAKPLVKRVAKAAALAAVAAIAHYSTRVDDEDGPPMFLVGSDHPDIREHVQIAQSEGGIRPIVHRRSSSHDRGWLYTNLVKGRCGPGLSGGATGKDCDECPMAIHTEGGKEHFLAGRVSIRPASLNQNRSVGSLVRAFHNACGITADDPGFDGAYVFGTTDQATHFVCGTDR